MRQLGEGGGRGRGREGGREGGSREGEMGGGGGGGGGGSNEIEPYGNQSKQVCNVTTTNSARVDQESV